MSDLTDTLRGRFLVLDGPDGAGKSTQLKQLADWLDGQGLSVTLARDPGGTMIGDKIRQILLDPDHENLTLGCEILLYMASRAQLYGEVILPALEREECVLCDRWVSATVAYQGAAGVVSEDQIMEVYRVALPDVQPDLTLIVDLPAKVGLSRVGKEPDRIENKSLAYHEQVRELFLEQARHDPERFSVVDGAGEIDDVQERLRQAIIEWSERI